MPQPDRDTLDTSPESAEPAQELLCDQAELERLCARWRAAGSFAFDTEFIRDDTYEARLCLVQAVGGGAGEKPVLIDPMAPTIDLKPFWDLVTDPQIVTIVHAGKEDFEVCLRASGKPPRNVFDVQIAAGFAGYGYPLSLTRLVEVLRRKRLRKGQTLTDWSIRPLTDEQIRYAIDDVAHLPSMYGKLSRELERRKRTAWAMEEFLRFESSEHYVPPVADRVQKLRGSKSLDGLGMLTLERLLKWRDAWAQEKNRPVRALIRDDILVELARRRPRHARELAVLRGFPQARNAKVTQALVDVIEECRATPKEKWPQPVEAREETAMMRSTIDLLSAVSRAVCFEQELSHDLLGGASRLRELIEYELGGVDTVPPLLRGWRLEFLGERLLDLLRGRCQLHFTGWPKSPRLDVVLRDIGPHDSTANGAEKPAAEAVPAAAVPDEKPEKAKRKKRGD
ncbi:MAG: ribonuclease D [Phycisphaerae bacterium]|nr:ribonuclease D [Phycisphaerae bacterium]